MMSCAQVAAGGTPRGGMSSLVGMRSSCPRNPTTTSSSAPKQQQSCFSSNRKSHTKNSNKNTTTNSNSNNNNNRDDDSASSGAEILNPGPHDVLLGRGGGTNNHQGNINFRRLVNEHKHRYLACSKIEKPNVAREVVQLWQQLKPPGRFLTRKEDGKENGTRDSQTDDSNVVIWVEVSEKKAREKASQCLRERTPDVVPYIRQLREHQDQMTEQGVTMVQQQLQMQREAEAQQNSMHVAAVTGGMGANFARRNSLAEHNPYQHQQVNPMGVVSNADFVSRRGSMPLMQGASAGANGGMMTMQQQHHAAFNRRVSAPHLSSNNNLQCDAMGGMPRNPKAAAAAMMGQQMLPHGGAGAFGNGMYGSMEPGFVASANDGIYDPAYASSMTALQLQQHHQHQMQMQQLQIQQQQLQQQMQMQQQQMHVNMQHQAAAHMTMRMPHQHQGQWNMTPYNVSSAGGMNNISPNHSGHSLSPHDSGHGSDLSPNNSGSNLKKSSSSNRNRQRKRAQDAPRGGDLEPLPLPVTSGVIPDEQEQPQARRVDPPEGSRAKHVKAKKPEQLNKPVTPSPTATKRETRQLPLKKQNSVKSPAKADSRRPREDDDSAPIPLASPGVDEDAHGELTLEEYRKTLESYMASNNIAGADPAGYNSSFKEDDLSVESFEEWPEHQEERPPVAKRGREPPASRKVDRHKSGQSMMSCQTFKSNATSLSGLSMLSNMSMDDKSGNGKNNSSRRFSSNASIMSELTDISHTIDGLALDDDC